MNIDLVAYGVCSEENGIFNLFQTVKKRIVKEFEVSWKAILHRVCPLVFDVSGEVFMDSANFVPSSKINEQMECSHNTETLILVTKYRVTAM